MGMHSSIPKTIRRLALGALMLATPLLAPSLASAATASNSTQFSVTAGSLSFGTAPLVPNFPAVTLNGQSQTSSAQMNALSVIDATGSGAGWNVTANGDASAGKSAVFKQYCSNGANPCGTDAANSYVSGGATLPASSLSLTSTGASFTAQNGTTGTAPTHQCATPCVLDVPSTSPTKIISAASGAGMGTWQASSYGASSLGVAIPTTTKVLPASEVYRLDLLWTLGTGP
jgi:hypothetical protein